MAVDKAAIVGCSVAAVAVLAGLKLSREFRRPPELDKSLWRAIGRGVSGHQNRLWAYSTAVKMRSLYEAKRYDFLDFVRNRRTLQAFAAKDTYVLADLADERFTREF